MEARACMKYARISPRKAKVVCDLIRGKDVETALAILKATPKAASELLIKVLNSAVANAENNLGLETEELFVSACAADPGPILKRVQPRAQGRMYRINKRTSHLTVVVSDGKEDNGLDVEEEK